VKHGNVTLNWGITDSLDLYKWRQQVEAGKMKDARKKMAIVLLYQEGQAAARWELNAAWPTKYSSPSLNATANEIAIETLEIAHEGMTRIK
jgi:phage tail-like protein